MDILTKLMSRRSTQDSFVSVFAKGKMHVFSHETWENLVACKDKEDKLEELFAKQYALQTDVMHYEFSSMSEIERGEFVRNYSLYCIDELSEMLHEVPFYKLWKKYSTDAAANTVAWQKARMEFVDALHFFLNIAIGLGFTPDELYKMYCAKNEVNHKRQEDTANYKPSNDAP